LIAQTSFSYLKIIVSSILLQSAFKITSPFSDASFLRDFLPRLAAYQVSNSTKFAAVQADRGQSVFPSYPATCPDWFCSTSYAEIRVAVTESEIWVADFRQMALVCVTQLMNLELTDVFTTKRR